MIRMALVRAMTARTKTRSMFELDKNWMARIWILPNEKEAACIAIVRYGFMNLPVRRSDAYDLLEWNHT
jgi:hypothetical protein